MNIYEIGKEGAPLGVGSLKSAALQQAKATSTQAAGAFKDSVDLSGFSKLMAKGVKALEEELCPRADKISRFAGELDKPVNLSEPMVNTILGRMAGL